MSGAGGATAQSWLPVEPRSDFSLANLPLGVFRSNGLPRIGSAIGDRAVDLAALDEAGLLAGIRDPSALRAASLNALFAEGREATAALRARLFDLLREDGDPALREGNVERLLPPLRDVAMQLPVEIGDYVDFYSSLEHATNLGRLFRPDGEPLLPNWRWIPIGYHGRSGTIVVDGTPIVRPHGQRKPPGAARPQFGPSALLDIELELGFFTGRPNALGSPIPVGRALDHIAGVVLVNDWSARDIQAWEYQPLGPFLGKSFATTISPWVVTLEALEPFRVPAPPQDPPPLHYLASENRDAYDIHLAIDLQTEAMRAAGIAPHEISRTNFRTMYWSMAQQLAHATANGAVARTGDLFASGTISGSQANSCGSLIELTWRGTKPLTLPSGETRGFLEDGDEITLRGWCERPGASRIGLGAARGRIVCADYVVAGVSSHER